MIRIEGLRKVFGAITALDGLDLSVARGAVFGFLGPNGSGKTTTMRILCGLARPSSGSAWVAGADVSRDRSSVARRIGFLPEEPAFYPWMSPREFLDHVARVFGMPAAQRRIRIDELLQVTGLQPVSARRIGGFSRGMRQRLGLAQALVNHPEVLLLDEPVSALDPAGRKEVLQLIDQLRGSCTVFMSTHILADVERVCDTVGVIARGRVVAQAAREELLDRYALPAFAIEVSPGGEVELAAWLDRIRGQPFVDSIEREGVTAKVRVNDVTHGQRELLRLAVESSLAIVRYELTRPSLEDVFLKLVGPERGPP